MWKDYFNGIHGEVVGIIKLSSFNHYSFNSHRTVNYAMSHTHPLRKNPCMCSREYKRKKCSVPCVCVSLHTHAIRIFTKKRLLMCPYDLYDLL